jgi:uncharacterized phage protein (TIGR01671 family)
MREIKFRTWDTDRKKMFVVTKLFMDGLGVNPTYSMELEHEGCYGDLYPLMQFTGLKDQTGKEIYEGDIVDWGGDKHAVIFRDGTFGYLLTDHAAKTEEFFCMPQAKANHVGIIGNIYENPELLK